MAEFIEVRIQGQNIRLKADSGQEYVRELAKYVEGVMDEIGSVMRQQRQTASQRIAIMAALQIADDYMRLKRRVEGGSSDFSEKVGALIRASDRVLGRE